jgi:hypothetical protein
MSVDLAEFGRSLTLPSVVFLWFGVLLRSRVAVRSQPQRGLWLAVVTAAAAMTLNLPAVIDLAVWDAESTHAVALTRNMIGVVSAAAVLHFVAASTGGRRLRITTSVTMCSMMGVLVTLDVMAGPHGEHRVPPVGNPTPSLAYWVTLTAAHLLANTVCGFVCWRYSRRTTSQSLALGLSLFGFGTALAGLFWLVHLARVVLGSTWALSYAPLLMNLHGFFRGAALLVPTFSMMRRTVADGVAAWHLWPLWRDLVKAMPQVALAKPRGRIVELLWPPAPRELLVYRKVIETRDAILILNDYIGQDTPELARNHLADCGVPSVGNDAAVLACVIKDARLAKITDRSRCRGPFSIASLGSSDLDDEKRFLVDVARAYTSASTRSFNP